MKLQQLIDDLERVKKEVWLGGDTEVEFNYMVDNIFQRKIQDPQVILWTLEHEPPYISIEERIYD